MHGKAEKKKKKKKKNRNVENNYSQFHDTCLRLLGHASKRCSKEGMNSKSSRVYTLQLIIHEIS